MYQKLEEKKRRRKKEEKKTFERRQQLKTLFTWHDAVRTTRQEISTSRH